MRGEQHAWTRRRALSLLLASIFAALACAIVQSGAVLRRPEHALPWHNTTNATTSSWRTALGEAMVLNLERRADRRRNVMAQLAKSQLLHEIGVHRIAAYDGQAAPLHRLVMDGFLAPSAYESVRSHASILGHHMTIGALGCIMSHARAWERVVRLDRPALVLEDDIQLLPDFDEKLASILSELPRDWGLLYLADLVRSPEVLAAQKDYSGRLWKLSGAYWGMYAYAVAPSAARLLLANMFPMRHQADSFVIHYTQKLNVLVFRSKVNLVTTNNSQVRDTDVQVLYGRQHGLGHIPRILHRLAWTKAQLALMAAAENKTHSTQAALLGWTTTWHSMESVLARLAEDQHGVQTPPPPSPLQRGDSLSRQQMIACLVVLMRDGGVCAAAEYEILRPLDEVAGESRGFWGLSRGDQILPDIFGGARDLPFFQELLSVMSLQNKGDNVELGPRQLREMVERLINATQGQELALLPAHIFDPLPVHSCAAAGCNNATDHPAFDKYAFAFKRQPLLQSRVFKDDGASLQIPRILHFVWPLERISSSAAQSMRQWMANHPSWTVMFWAAARPKTWSLRDKQSPTQATDALRYRVVYEHGGVYVDPNFESLISLEGIVGQGSLRHGFACLERSRGSHAVFLSDKIFGFSRRHPIMRRAMSLARDAALRGLDVGGTAGPEFFRRRAVADDMDKLYILSADAFFPGCAGASTIPTLGLGCDDAIEKSTKIAAPCTQSYAAYHWPANQTVRQGWLSLRKMQRLVHKHNKNAQASAFLEHAVARHYRSQTAVGSLRTGSQFARLLMPVCMIFSLSAILVLLLARSRHKLHRPGTCFSSDYCREHARSNV